MQTCWILLPGIEPAMTITLTRRLEIA